jgi:hypothetical protein
MNGEKIKIRKYIIIISTVLFVLITLSIIIVIKNTKNKEQIYIEDNKLKYKIKLTVNLVDNNGKNELIFSDNNISGVRVTAADNTIFNSPSIFIVYFNSEEERERLRNITKNNIGNNLLLYYNNELLSFIKIINEIVDNQLIFENIDDPILLDIVNNIFEKIIRLCLINVA